MARLDRAIPAFLQNVILEVALVSRMAVIFEHRNGAAYWP
jgi:hypothetical protein